jgi:hypothetical protein
VHRHHKGAAANCAAGCPSSSDNPAIIITKNELEQERRFGQEHDILTCRISTLEGAFGNRAAILCAANCAAATDH